MARAEPLLEARRPQLGRDWSRRGSRARARTARRRRSARRRRRRPRARGGGCRRPARLPTDDLRERRADEQRRQHRERAGAAMRERIGQARQRGGDRRQRDRRGQRPRPRSAARDRRSRDGRTRAPAPSASRPAARSASGSSPSRVSNSTMRRVGPMPGDERVRGRHLGARLEHAQRAHAHAGARGQRDAGRPRAGPGGSGCERRKSGTISTGATTVNSSSTRDRADRHRHPPAVRPRAQRGHEAPQGERREHGADRERLGLVGEPARQALAREPGAARGAPAEQRERQAREPERGDRRPGVDGRVERRAAPAWRARSRCGRRRARPASASARHDRPAQAPARACAARR